MYIGHVFRFFFRMEKVWKRLGAQSRASAFLLVMHASLRIAIAIDIHIYTYVLIYIYVYVYITYTYIHIFCNYIYIIIYTRNYACVNNLNRFKCRIRHFYKQLFTSHVPSNIQHPEVRASHASDGPWRCSPRARKLGFMVSPAWARPHLRVVGKFIDVL
jgi:hypothetical protein